MIDNEDKFNDLLEFYTSGETLRWHNKPNVPPQSVKHHTAGMLMLLIKLHPNPSERLMRAIIEHDLPETDGYFFDAPHDAKQQFPVLREIEEVVTARFKKRFDLPEVFLTEVEKLWLKYLDGLETLCYIVTSVNSENPVANKIYNRQSELTLELEKQLQALGFLNEPAGTVH